MEFTSFYFSTAILKTLFRFCVWEMISLIICYIISVIYVLWFYSIIFNHVNQFILEAGLEM